MTSWGITPDAFQIGVRLAVCSVVGVGISREKAELERWKRMAQARVRGRGVNGNPILDGYRAVLAAAGIEGLPSVELLLHFLERHGRLPTINTCVDAYNIYSLEHHVVVSVHDADRLVGPLRMVRLERETPFAPLGSSSIEVIPAGGFGIRDDRHLLCVENRKQSRESAVTVETRNLAVAAQGSPALEGVRLSERLAGVCECIIAFNGGQLIPATRIEIVAPMNRLCPFPRPIFDFFLIDYPQRGASHEREACPINCNQ